MRPSPRAAALVLAVGVLLAVGAACSPPPDHRELAVQQTDNGALVIHFADCSDPELDEIRVVSDWGDVQEDMITFSAADLGELESDFGPTAVAIVPRRFWPPRLRFEVEGDEPFEVTFDPDDVPPVEWQLLVPDAPDGGEVVDLDDFDARCD